MKLYQINFDTVFITLIAEDVNDMVSLLNDEYDEINFYLENDKIFYTGFGEPYECIYNEVVFERGIIQHESH